MKWLKGNKSTFNSVELVDKKHKKYFINLSPRDYTPEEVVVDDKAVVPDMEYLQKELVGIPSTYDVKQLLIECQKEYDKSYEVNGFIINGSFGWLDKSTRIGIKNSIDIFKDEGKTEYIVWISGISYNLAITDIDDMLVKIEKYAMKCNENTFEHLDAINNLTNRNDILNYNVSTGYPEKLVFEYTIVNNE